jgi:peroxiredoxin
MAGAYNFLGMRKVFLAILMAGLVFCLTANAEPAPLIGTAAPDLSLTAVNGHVVNLQDYLGSKKIILVFFTSWSKSCQGELDALNELYRSNKANLEVVAVSFDKKSQDLKSYLTQANLAFPVLQDKKLASIDPYQIVIIPTTFCLDRDGTIAKVFVDYDDNVKKALEEWLKK